MGLRTMLAKSAWKYAGEQYKSYREKRQVKVDLAPVLLKLDALAANQPPQWISYAALVLSFLTLVVAVWILVRMF